MFRVSPRAGWRLHVDALDGVDELLVDARDEGDGSARDTGNDIGHSHGTPLEGQNKVLMKFHRQQNLRKVNQNLWKNLQNSAD